MKTTNWVEESRELLLEQAKLMAPLQERLQDPAVQEKMMKLLEPLADGSVDPGDLDLVTERLIEIVGGEELLGNAVRREAEIHLALRTSYERLGNATEKDVQAFVRMRLEAQLRGSGMLEFWAKTAKALAKGPDEESEVPTN